MVTGNHLSQWNSVTPCEIIKDDIWFWTIRFPGRAGYLQHKSKVWKFWQCAFWKGTSDGTGAV